MEKMILTNPEIAPDKNVLEAALGKVFLVYVEMFSTLTDNQVGLEPEWRYYKDGKAWLCKVQFRKKTVFWLSVWEGYFKITFYFTAKNLDSFRDLAIDSSIKEQLNQVNPIGKLIPLTLNISKMEQLDDVKKLVDFKKKQY